MPELDTSPRNQPLEPPPGQEVDPNSADFLRQSYPTPRSGDAPPAAGPPGGAPPAALVGNLADLQRKKIANDDQVMWDTERRQEEDRERALSSYRNAQGIGRDMVKPWNAEEEHKKYETGALESFGSFASVFAIVASAFTHAPLTNALNGSAAAMNAIREGDEKKYDRAYTAWKDNMSLAEKRFNMEQAMYRDAMTLMSTDAALGEIKLKNAMQRFGDRQGLMLIEAGYPEKVFERMEAQQKAAKGAFETNQLMTKQKLENDILKTDPKYNVTEQQEPDPQKRAAMKMEAYYRTHMITNANNIVDQTVGLYILQELQQKKDVNPEDIAEFRMKAISKFSAAGDRSAAIDERVEQLVKDNPSMTRSDARVQATRDYNSADKKSGSGGPDAKRRDEIYNKKIQEWREKNPGKEPDADTLRKANDEVYGRGNITAGRRDEIRSYIDRATNFEQTIDKVEGMLTKHNALAGLGGRVTRPAEAIGNVFGSNDTDRAQFARWISEMKEWAPRVLNETRGRPLASEAGQVDRIVAGMSMGDTTANTVRAYRELKPLIAKIKADLMKREAGEWTPPPSGGNQPAPAPASRSKWMDAPLVEQ